MSGILDEPECVDLDANALPRRFLRLARRNGAKTVVGAEARRITRRFGAWRIEAGADTLETPVLVNTAGAWVDEMADRTGLPRRGVKPLRRTATHQPAGGDLCGALAWASRSHSESPT